jgi:hypothetical protein
MVSTLPASHDQYCQRSLRNRRPVSSSLAFRCHVQRIKGLMLATLRPEAVAESDEVLLVDTLHHRANRVLDDFVFERRDSQRTLSSVSLFNVNPDFPRAFRSALPPVEFSDRCGRLPSAGSWDLPVRVFEVSTHAPGLRLRRVQPGLAAVRKSWVIARYHGTMALRLQCGRLLETRYC